MEKKTKIVVISGIIIVLITSFFIMASFSLGISVGINNFLNKLVAGEPDKHCNVDSDCVLRNTGCSICSCLNEAVNKDWKSFCPLKYSIIVKCEVCADFGEFKCVENKCLAIRYD